MQHTQKVKKYAKTRSRTNKVGKKNLDQSGLGTSQCETISPKVCLPIASVWLLSNDFTVTCNLVTKRKL